MCRNSDSSCVVRGTSYLERRGNYIDGSHTSTRYGQELLPSSEDGVPLGRTILWRRFSFCLRPATVRAQASHRRRGHDWSAHLSVRRNDFANLGPWRLSVRL